MERKIERFFGEYQELTHRVSVARHRDFASVLRRWFACIDQAPQIVSVEVQRLEQNQSWKAVEQDVLRKGGSMAGSGQLNWPDDKDSRIGAQLLLLRKLASEEIRLLDFSLSYFYAGDNNIDSMISELASHFFEPHAEELFRRLEDVVEDATAGEIEVLNSYRVVKLDQNAEEVSSTLSAIEDTIVHLRENNEIDPETKVRVEAELKSGMELIKAPETRLAAVSVLLVTTLGWLTTEFASSLVGIAAGKAVELVRILFGV